VVVTLLGSAQSYKNQTVYMVAEVDCGLPNFPKASLKNYPQQEKLKP